MGTGGPARWLEGPGVAFGAASLLAVVLAAVAGVSYFDFYHRDVGWSLYVAEQMVDGARLYADVIDENPPWLFWLSTTPVALSRLLGVEANTLYNAFVFLVSASSAAVIYVLLRRGWPEVDPSLRVALTMLVASALVLLPGSEFGQREDLLAATVMPYLFAAASWLRGHALRPGLAVTVGLFASIGLLFKPHFYLLCVFVELLLLMDGRARGGGSWRRVEAWTIAVVAVAYAVSVPLLYPHYFDVVRVALQYYDGYGSRWSPWVLVAPGVGWALVAAALCALMRSTAMNRELRRVLLAAVAGLVLAGFLQFKGWHYHFDGARLTAAVLLGLVILGPLAAPGRIEQILRARAALIPIIALSVLLSCGTLRLGGAIEARVRRAEAPQTVFGELVRVVKEHAGEESILTLSTSVFPAFPLVNATGAEWPSRYWALWLLPGLYSPEEKSTSPFPYRTRDEMDELEREFLDNFVDDMLAGQPALLIVDRLALKQGFAGSSFDFLTYMLRDERFAASFKGYAWLTDIGEYRVYERVQPSG
jgi:hypothetical protein